MAKILDDLFYTPDHEYVKSTSDPAVVVIGITDFAQGELGDIVYLDLPKSGAKFDVHGTFGTVEAVKAVSELYAPVAGEVVEINPRLDKEPMLVNSDPYGEGWMIKVRVAGDWKKGLLDATAYKKHVGQ